MTYGFFDYWKNLNDGFERHNLSALTQLVGYKLLAEFNKAKFSGVTLTDRELKAITNIHSLKSIHDAKAQLKQFNLIDFKTQKNKPTIYSLCEPLSKHEVNTEETPSKHEVNTAYSNNSENNQKEEDLKTIRPEDIKRKKIRERASYFPHLQFDEKLWLWWEKDCLDDELVDEELVHYSEMQSKYGVEKLKVAMKEAFGKYRRKTGWLAVQRILENPKGEMKNGRSSDTVNGNASKYADLR